MTLLTRSARLDGKEAPTDADPFFEQLIHFGMAFFRNSRGQTLAERWREKGFVGLTNDEQVAVAAYGRSFVSVLEMQDAGKHSRTSHAGSDPAFDAEHRAQFPAVGTGTKVFSRCGWNRFEVVLIPNRWFWSVRETAREK